MSQLISFKLSELAAEFAALLPDCQFESDGTDPSITGVAAIASAQAGEITFISSAKFMPLLEDTQASAVILDLTTPSSLPCIRTAYPQILLAKILEKFNQPDAPIVGIHPTAIFGEDVQIGKNVAIAPYVVLGDRVKIGDHAIIDSRVTIYNDVEIGANTIIHTSCVIGDHTQIGANCIIYPNTVLGGDGFGFDLAPDGNWYKLPQIGHVIIEDNVEIGCSCGVDRAAVGVTTIHEGAKLDNLVQIGHGVEVGAHSRLGAQVGLAGGAALGDHVVMAEQVGSAYHIYIGDGANIGVNSGIPSNVPAGARMVGYPVVPEEDWHRIAIAKSQLPDLLRTVRKLEQQITELEAKISDRRQGA
jgi:UDP-3-O-[3-hydroxymyristoyl] glucosamine N-acyltransferase